MRRRVGLKRKGWKPLAGFVKTDSPRGRRTSERRASQLELRKACDFVMGVIVKVRDRGRCVLCSSDQYPQWAHLVSRRYHGTRWQERNGWTLCRRCHMKWTYDPLGWDALVEQRIGAEAWATLKACARILSKPDYLAILAGARARLLELSSRIGVPEGYERVLREALMKCSKYLGGEA
jgi:hypothetical protein